MPMTEMHAGVPEPDAGERRRQQHFGARLIVVAANGANEIARDHFDRAARPDVADRVRSLIGRPKPGTAGASRLMERQAV